MNRYSFIGKGSILIRAGVAANYGGKHFDESEPIAYFNDVDINIDFSNTDKVVKVGAKNLAADSQSRPSLLKVDNIKITESLQSLLYKKQTNNVKSRTLATGLVSQNKVIYLPIQTDEVISNIFIYDGDKVRVTDFTYLDGVVTLTNINQEDGRFNIFYTITQTSLGTFFLENQSTPNVAAEITVKGNINGITGDAVISLSRLQILSNPTFDFTEDNPFVSSLEFAILESKEPVEINYYG